MKSKPILTLPMLNDAVKGAEEAHARAQRASDVQAMVKTRSDLNRARAAVREFIYHSKSLGGKCNLIRH